VKPSAWRAIVAGTVLNAPLGSLYAFSVFLKPLEALLGLSRAELAFVFGLSSIGFAAGMNAAPYLYGLASTPALVLWCAVASAAGIALAAAAGGLAQLTIGYSVLFGLGGGAAYIIVQQAVNLAVTRRHGLVNGYIVALYPLGAMIAAPLFGWGIRAFGVRATMGGLAVVLVVTGVCSAWLIGRARVPLASGGASAAPVYGTTFIAGTIAVARVGGGWMADWLTIPTVAAGAHVIALGGNVALTLWPGPMVAVIALALVGFGYGLISGVTAAAVAVYWRRALYGLIASRIYLAWCAAAIILPTLAGYLFDMTRGYGAAVMIAAAGNVAGIALAVGLPRQSKTGGSDA
jgi:hypothetical protein